MKHSINPYLTSFSLYPLKVKKSKKMIDFQLMKFSITSTFWFENDLNRRFEYSEANFVSKTERVCYKKYIYFYIELEKIGNV
jgi:hypothetical protein